MKETTFNVIQAYNETESHTAYVFSHALRRSSPALAGLYLKKDVALSIAGEDFNRGMD
jgi:hypothetical protein